MRPALLALSASIMLTVVSCGTPPKPEPSAPGGEKATKTAAKIHQCGDKDKVHQHELDAHEAGQTEAFVPCSASGGGDYSGLIRIESEPDGIHITIDATDDQVVQGALGSDVKTRDAVIVYPRGKGSEAVEVPLTKTEHGYRGEKVIPYDKLDKLTDEGTKIDVAIFDHDKANEPSEEMHVQVAVSTGKSCEKAIDENPQQLDMGKKGGAPRPDLTDAQLGAPMKTSGFFSQCGLADKENAEICVAVKNGKPIGVSVGVEPSNRKTAACIDRATRKLHFPVSDKLDVVHQKF